MAIDLRTSLRQKKSLRKLLAKALTKQAGYSLMAVLVLGAVTSLWVEALMATMVPTYERMTLVQGRNMARSAAEAGLDYVVSQLTASAASGNNSAPWSNYDTSTYGQTQYTVMPASIIGSSSMRVVPQVVVGVTNYAPSSNSAIYDGTVAAKLPPNTAQNPWRIIDSYAVVGPFSKHIRLILEPNIVTGTASSQNALPSLPFAIFGNIQQDSIGMVSIQSYNNPSNQQYWNADVGSNGTVNELGTGDMTRPVLEGGNHIELPDPAIIQMPGQQITFNNGMGGTVVASAPWLQIGNNVYSNNNTDGYNGGPVTGPPYPAGYNSTNGTLPTLPATYPSSPLQVPQSPTQWNVLGMNNGVQSNGAPVGGSVTEYQTYALATIPPAPTAPTGSYGSGSSMPSYQASGGLSAPGSINLGNISLSNGSQLVISDSATSIPNSLNISDGSTVTIPPGNYIVNSLAVNDTSSIVVNSTNPTGIYIQGNTPGNAAIAISNTATINVTANGSNGSPPVMELVWQPICRSITTAHLMSI